MPGLVGALGPSLPDRWSEFTFRSAAEAFINTGNGTVSVAAMTSGISATVNKAIATMLSIAEPTKVKGLILPQTTAIAVASMDFNLGIFTAVMDGSLNWAPGALYSTVLQGTCNVPITASNNYVHYLSFTGSLLLPPGDYFISGCYRCNGATTGAFQTAGVRRVSIGGSVNGRFDLHSTTNVTYQSTDLSTIIPGSLVWNDTSGGSAANINFATWNERLP